MSSSIIVPCYFRHFVHLYELLKAYTMQTVLPDEIVISVSEADKISQQEIDDFESKIWPFHVVILKTTDRLSAGQNRNKACRAAKSALFICQDADDLPHPQRIEIIKYLFQKHKLDHLIHGYIPTDWEFQPYHAADLPFLFMDNMEEVVRMTRMTNGSLAMRRYVFDSIQWTEEFGVGEDYGFNIRVYKKFFQRGVLAAPLIKYRAEYSSFNH